MKASQYRLIPDGFLIVALSVFLLQACGEVPEPEVKDVVRPVKMPAVV
jgi:hypothetical protein